jgi:tetratricopeptide (TPR) repeat protein
MAKPCTFLATGHCQSLYLGAALASLPDGFVVYQDPPVLQMQDLVAKMCGDNSLIDERPWAIAKRLMRDQMDRRSVVLIEQMGADGPVRPPPLGVERYLARTVRFPAVEFYALWPQTKFPPEVAKRADRKRLLASDLEAIRLACAACDFSEDVYGYVAEHLARRPLFYNFGHPDGPLLALILRGILRQLEDLVPEAEAAALVAKIEQSPGFNLDSWHPIPEPALRELGFRWSDDPAYAAWQQAQEAFDAQRYAEAIELCTRALALAPSGYLLLLLSRCHARLGQLDEAIRTVKEALEYFPRSPTLKLHLVEQHLRRGEFAIARELSEAGVAEQPELPAFKMQLSKALAGEGRLDEALEFAAAASAPAKARADVFTHHVGLLVQAGRLDEAAEVCRRGLETHPEHALLQRQQKHVARLQGVAPATAPDLAASANR